MSGFTLDTSGRVNITSDPAQGFIRWSDLPPFAQGYTEALMLAIQWPDPAEGFGPSSSVIRFEWLAPETLALILRDCEALLTHARDGCRVDYNNRADGRWFWEAQARGNWVGEGFPVRTPYLSDAGKVCLSSEAPSQPMAPQGLTSEGEG